MAALAVASWWAAVWGRWMARILGTLMVLLFLALLFGEGPPKPSDLTSAEKLQFLGMFGLFLGLMLAWKWEGLGGLVSVAGFAVLTAISRTHLTMWAFWLPAAIACVHILCWERLHFSPPAGLAPWNLPRSVVLTLLAMLAIFLLLCSNEIFGRPPLMTPALRPSADLAGTWRAPFATLSIHSDASVSGSIHDVEVRQARVANNRSWFGRLMHINSEYLVTGSMAGKQFLIPLTPRGEVLAGSLVIDGRPTRLDLRRGTVF